MIDPISTDGAFPYLLVCLLRVSNRILNDFFLLWINGIKETWAKRRFWSFWVPRGSDTSGRWCLGPRGQGFADFGSAEISQTGRRSKLTDEPWSYSKLVNNRVSDSEVCCPSQQWEPPGKVFGFCSTCPTKNVFRFSHLFRFRFWVSEALGFSLWFTVLACGCTVFGFRFMAGPGSEVGSGCRWGKACCLLDKEQEMGPLSSWASRWSREKRPPSTTRETWFKLRLGIGDKWW